MTPTLAESLIADTVPSLRTTRRGKYTGMRTAHKSRTRPLCGCSDRMTKRPASSHLLLHPDDGVRARRAEGIYSFVRSVQPGDWRARATHSRATVPGISLVQRSERCPRTRSY